MVSWKGYSLCLLHLHLNVVRVIEVLRCSSLGGGVLPSISARARSHGGFWMHATFARCRNVSITRNSKRSILCVRWRVDATRAVKSRPRTQITTLESFLLANCSWINDEMASALTGRSRPVQSCRFLRGPHSADRGTRGH